MSDSTQTDKSESSFKQNLSETDVKRYITYIRYAVIAIVIITLIIVVIQAVLTMIDQTSYESLLLTYL